MAERGYWPRMLMLNAGGTLLAFGIALGGGTSSWRDTLLVLFQTVVYTTCVGTLARIVQPPILRRVGSSGVYGFTEEIVGTFSFTRYSGMISTMPPIRIATTESTVNVSGLPSSHR